MHSVAKPKWAHLGGGGGNLGVVNKDLLQKKT